MREKAKDRRLQKDPLDQTKRANFKATLPKLSGPKRLFILLSCLDLIRKTRQCWMEDVLKWTWQVTTPNPR